MIKYWVPLVLFFFSTSTVVRAAESKSEEILTIAPLVPLAPLSPSKGKQLQKAKQKEKATRSDTGNSSRVAEPDDMLAPLTPLDPSADKVKSSEAPKDSKPSKPHQDKAKGTPVPPTPSPEAAPPETKKVESVPPTKPAEAVKAQETPPAFINGMKWTEPTKAEMPKPNPPETKKEEKVLAPAPLIPNPSVVIKVMPKKEKIAVLDVRAIGTFDPKAVQGLTSFIVSEAAKSDLTVLSGNEISAIIGFERQKQLLGCSDSSCLADIGGALGADYLLDTEVSEVGGTWLLTSTLISTKKSQAIKRITRKVEKIGILIDNAQLATEEVLLALPKVVVVETASPPSHPMRTTGIVTACAGAASLGVGIYFGTERNRFANSIDPPNMKYAQATSAKNSANDAALKANVLLGVGGGLLAIGAALITADLVTTPSTSVTITASGNGMAVSGTW